MTGEDGRRSPSPAIAAVILAAGRSSRMPAPSKLMRDFRGESVIRTVARTAARAGLDPVVVVSAGGDGLDRHLRDLPVHVSNVEQGRGDRLTSVLAGLRVPPVARANAVLLLLGDEPELDGADIEAVRAAWLAGGADLIRTRYRDRPGHPVVLAADLAARVLADPPAAGDLDRVWDRLRERSRGWVEVRVSRLAPIDVDTLDDLARARSRGRSP